MFEKAKNLLAKYKALEINRRTQDVQDDLKFYDFKRRVRYLGFNVGALITGIAIFGVVTYMVEQNAWRHALIHNANVSPLASLLYTDYTADMDNIEKELKSLNEKKQAIEQKLYSIQGAKAPEYSFAQFQKSVQSGKITLNIDSQIKASKLYHEAIEMLNLAFLVQKWNEKIVLNDKEYTLNSAYSLLKKIEDKKVFETNFALFKEAIKSQYGFDVSQEQIEKSLRLDYGDKTILRYVDTSANMLETIRNAALNNARQIVFPTNQERARALVLNNTLKLEELASIEFKREKAQVDAKADAEYMAIVARKDALEAEVQKYINEIKDYEDYKQAIVIAAQNLKIDLYRLAQERAQKEEQKPVESEDTSLKSEEMKESLSSDLDRIKEAQKRINSK